MNRLIALGLAAAAGILLAAGPAAAHQDKMTTLKNDRTIHMARRSIVAFRKADPTLARYFRQSAGFVVFPKVSKGAAGIGGAGGRGAVFLPGKKDHDHIHAVGIAKLSQFTVGVQLGGQTFREIIFFEDQRALDNFKYGGMKLAAAASAIVAADGAAASAAYENGVAIFTMPLGGLMFEASIGGQVMKFRPL